MFSETNPFIFPLNVRNGKNLQTDIFYHLALEEVKEYTDNIMYSTYPHIKLQQILSHTEWNKKQQERLSMNNMN